MSKIKVIQLDYDEDSYELNMVFESNGKRFQVRDLVVSTTGDKTRQKFSVTFKSNKNIKQLADLKCKKCYGTGQYYSDEYHSLMTCECNTKYYEDLCNDEDEQ